MGWFITQSLLFIIIAAVVFFLIGLWVGWILWARRGKGAGRHSAETGAEKKHSAPAEAESGTSETDSEQDSGTSSPSEIDDENLAVYAGAEEQVVAEAEAATRNAVGDESASDDAPEDAEADAEPEAEAEADLTRIEGIGPKISEALRTAGYGSFQKIADASETDLRAALAGSGIKFSPAASSFAAQAQYVVDGDDEGLAEYQDYLIAGRDRKSAEFVEEVDYIDVDEVEGATAKKAALAADAEKVAEATGSDAAVDAEAVTADAEADAADATATDEATAEPAPEQHADDDLRVIEGIGPKIAKALKADGITSYAQIAAMDEDALLASIRKSGIKFAPSVSSWAHQAQYLTDNDVDGLDEYQDYLIGGQDRGKTAFVDEVDYTDVDEIEGAEAKKAALEADAKKVAEAEGGRA